MPREGMVELEVSVLAETAAALRIRTDDGKEAWIPKSQIDEDSEVYSLKSSPGTMLVTEWIATQKELV